MRLGNLLKAARERTRRRHGANARVVFLAYVCESQRRGVFHPHLVLGYRTAADRAALETFRRALAQLRGSYGFGVGPGSLDAGKPDRFPPEHAARYISKYLRPDSAKASFVPLLEAVVRLTPRNEETGRLKYMLRPVYVSPVLTKLTGVTMGFLRFCRWVFAALKVQHTRVELLAMYRVTRLFGAFLEGLGVQSLAQPPPRPRPLLPAAPSSPLTLF